MGTQKSAKTPPAACGQDDQTLLMFSLVSRKFLAMRNIALYSVGQKICQKNLRTLRNQHQVTPSNTEVTNSLDGEEKTTINLGS